jgi:hypothetical protein
MRRLSTSERTVNPAGYAKPEELDADRAIKEHAIVINICIFAPFALARNTKDSALWL